MPKFLRLITFPSLGVARVVAAVTVVSIAVGACGGAPEPPAEEQTPAAEAPATPAQTFISAAPSALIQIYLDNNEYQAEEMASAYINRMLKVDAAVLSVSADPEGVVVVTSTGPEADPNDPTTMRLLFPMAAESSVSTLEAGANIQAGCQIRGISKTTIELADCALM